MNNSKKRNHQRQSITHSINSINKIQYTKNTNPTQPKIKGNNKIKNVTQYNVAQQNDTKHTHKQKLLKSAIKKHKITQYKDAYYIYGKHASLAAICNPKRKVIKIICSQKNALTYSKELQGLDIEIASSAQISGLFDESVNHQSIAALVLPITIKNFSLKDLAQKKRIAIFDEITDTHNFGALVRSAAAFGFSQIIIPTCNSAQENGAMAKSAAGCLEHVYIYQVNNISNAMNELKQMGFWIAGLDVQGTSSLKDIAKIDKLVIVVGSENVGMRRLTKSKCDHLVKINMNQDIESLNASIAGAITFHALML